MYAIRKPKGTGTDVFVMFPPARMAQPMPENVQWLVDHRVEFGYRDGSVVGVYLRDVDAVAFKLKFGL